MDGDPLLTGRVSFPPNGDNASGLPTVWIQDTELAARLGLGCLAGPNSMLTLRHIASARAYFEDGYYNYPANPFPICLMAFAERWDRGQRPENQYRGPAGVGVEQLADPQRSAHPAPLQRLGLVELLSACLAAGGPGGCRQSAGCHGR